MFNIFSEIENNLNHFFNEKIEIAGTSKNNGASRLSRRNNNYSFSQWETLNLIDLYYNSKFQSGELDDEGQRKVFLNICKFRADVSSKMIDLDVKDFVFIPDDFASQYPAWFLSKQFRNWIKDVRFSKTINQWVVDLPKYGTAIAKVIGDEVVRVPIFNIRNPQDCENLETAEWVIEEHQMTYSELVAMEGWDSTNVRPYQGRKTVYEWYGYVPYNFYTGEGDNENPIKCVYVCVMENASDKKGIDGSILFKDQIDEYPYLTAHWVKQDRRFLGIGEIENQFENQLSRNILANLRRKALYWSSKTIFQSPDDTIARNLIKDVHDGDVIRITPNGNITRLDNVPRNLAEFSSDENMWEQNSNQLSFTYEVTTGESLPSSTPFRLGVLLSSAVKSHFDLKRENFGLFLQEVFDRFILPIFERTAKEDALIISSTDKGFLKLKEAVIDSLVAKEITRSVLEDGVLPDENELRFIIANKISDRDVLYFNVKKEFYKDIKYKLSVNVVPEGIDVTSKMETYKSLYQIEQNPEIKQKILERIIQLTGDSYDQFKPSKTSLVQSAPMGNNMNVPLNIPTTPTE